MAFSGTTQRCKACDKTVHFIEMVSADGVAYHKTCFRCGQCNGKLSISNYHSRDGNLYCKPHFEQLLKECGTIPRSFSAGRQDLLTRAPSKLSAMFSGTLEKCQVCKKTVYPLEKVTVEGEFFHKNCFRCAHGGCNLTPSSYAALDGTIYCKPHFSQLFKEKGSYSTLNKTSSMKKADIDMPPEIIGHEVKTPQEEQVQADDPEPEPEPEP